MTGTSLARWLARFAAIAAPVGVVNSNWILLVFVGNLWARRISATAGAGFGYVRPEKLVTPVPTAIGLLHHLLPDNSSSSARYATPSMSTRVSADPSSCSSTSFAEWPWTCDSAEDSVSKTDLTKAVPHLERPSAFAHFTADDWRSLAFLFETCSSELTSTSCALIPPLSTLFVLTWT